MTRVVVASAAVAIAAIAAVLALAHASNVTGATPTSPLKVRAFFDPPSAQFGDAIAAHVVVLADRRELDTSRLRIAYDLSPLSRLGAPDVSRTTRGRLLTVSITVQLVCIAEQCLGQRGPRRLRLSAVRGQAPRTGGGMVRTAMKWPVLELRGRVVAADLAASRLPLRSDTNPPPVSYRIAPGTLSLLLDVLAAVLVAAGVALAARQAIARMRRRQAVDRRSDLDRALALVREAQTRSPQDRRLAVGLLARLLRSRDGALAHDAGELAWSEPQPAPEALGSLAEKAEAT